MYVLLGWEIVIQNNLTDKIQYTFKSFDRTNLKEINSSNN